MAGNSNQTGLAEFGITIRYLGQEGFLFRHGGISIVIDPYLTHSCDDAPDAPVIFWHRNYPPPVKACELHEVNLVLCTHDHLDHADPETLAAIAAASPDCIFAGPAPAAAVMERAGISPDRLRTLNAGESFPFQEIEIHPVAAAHESYQRDAGGRYACLGYVLLWNGLTLYHAGDTIPTPQLHRELEAYTVDVGFLPINGRNEERARRGIVGNMDSDEAIAFAKAHDFGLLVPMHYDLYTNNGSSLADFVGKLDAEDPCRKFKAFRPGERIIL